MISKKAAQIAFPFNKQLWLSVQGSAAKTLGKLHILALWTQENTDFCLPKHSRSRPTAASILGDWCTVTISCADLAL